MRLTTFTGPFLRDLKKDRSLAEDAFIEFRGGVFSHVFLDTANKIARVDTGALKAGIQAFHGTPPRQFERPEDADEYDRRPGTAAKLKRRTEAREHSRAAGYKGKFGFTSKAAYSSFVNDGTEKMAPRPFWDAAIAAADRVVAVARIVNGKATAR